MIVVYCDICGAKDAALEYTPTYPWERMRRNYLDPVGYNYADTTASAYAQAGLDTPEVINPTHFDMCKNCADKLGKLIEGFLRKQ